MSAPSISPIRFSVPPDLSKLTERLNKAMRQIETEMQGLRDQIAAAKQAAVATSKPGYPGIENGSVAMIGGPQPGGPSPLEPYLTPHSMLVGEGSTPVKQIVGTNGQIPIACTGNDPAFATITGDGTSVSVNLGVAIISGCNTIEISLNDSVQTWITEMQAWAWGMQTWADGVSITLLISPPSPTPPVSGPT